MRFILSIAALLASISIYSQDSLYMKKASQYNPVPTSEYSDVWGYTQNGGEYAVFGSREKIFFVDVSDCYDPEPLFEFDGGGTPVWRDFKHYNGYIYAVCDGCSEGLHIFSADGANITHELTTTAFFSKAHNIYIDEENDRLYAVGFGNNAGVPSGVDMVILDLSVDPANPTLLEEVDLVAYIHDVFVRDNIAYASHGYAGLYVWDMTDPTNPIDLGSHDAGGYNHSSWASENDDYLYYAEEVGPGRPIQVIDLANLGDPNNDIGPVNQLYDPLIPGGLLPPHNPFVKEDTLFISYYHDGIKVYDLADPSDPELLAYYDTYDNSTYGGYEGNWGAYPFLPSGCILASDISTGLYMLKVDFSLTDFPDLQPSVNMQPTNFNGTGQTSIIVSVDEVNGFDTDAAITVTLSKDSKLNFTYDPTLTNIFSIPVANSQWTYDGTNPDYHVWTHAGIITANNSLNFGMAATFDPGNTDGTLPLVFNIIGDSGGENNVENNTVSIKVSFTH